MEENLRAKPNQTLRNLIYNLKAVLQEIDVLTRKSYIDNRVCATEILST